MSWTQAVEHTSEYSPGPWDMVTGNVDSGADCQILSADRTRVLAVIRPTSAGRFPERRDGTLSPGWEDPEQEATARLMWEAQDMLLLLAKWLDVAPSAEAIERFTSNEHEALCEATAALLRRHCRPQFGESARVNHYESLLSEIADEDNSPKQPSLPGTE